MSIEACHRVELPTFRDARGVLSVIEGANLPFPIHRFYFVHSVPTGTIRGGHAHKREEELILALAGRFRIDVDDGSERRSFELDRPESGLLVPRMLWHELTEFSAGAVCAVLASEVYDPEDYYSSYEEFLAALGRR